MNVNYVELYDFIYGKTIIIYSYTFLVKYLNVIYNRYIKVIIFYHFFLKNQFYSNFEVPP